MRNIRVGKSDNKQNNDKLIIINEHKSDENAVCSFDRGRVFIVLFRLETVVKTPRDLIRGRNKKLQN